MTHRGGYFPIGSQPRRGRLRPIAAGAACLALGVLSVAWGSVLPAAAVDTTCLGTPATILGTDGADTLVGTEGPDVISAGNGNDTVTALGGDDIVCAGNGADTINGGLGQDILDTGRGDPVANVDVVHGGGDVDDVFLSRGADQGFGDSGFAHFSFQETITPGTHVEGGTEGGNLVVGSAAARVDIDATTGVAAVDGSPVLTFAAIQDFSLRFTSAGRQASFQGTEARESVQVFNASRVSIHAGAGDDSMTVVSVPDGLVTGTDLIGGAGADFLTIESGAAGYRADLGTHALVRNGTSIGTIGAESLTFRIDRPSGRPGAGSLNVVGSNRADDLRLSARTMTLTGLGGGDRLQVLRSAPYASASVEGGAGNDFLVGGGRVDHISGGPGDDSMLGDSGGDTLVGGSGNDLANGQGGVDTCVAETLLNCEL